MWLLAALEGISLSCWNGTVFSSFLFDLMGANFYVGLVNGVLGLVQVLGAYPVGWLADRYGKARLVFCAAVVLPVAVGGMSFAAAWGAAHHHDANERIRSFWLMFGGTALYGLGLLAGAGPVQSLYADSIPTGDRTGPRLELQPLHTALRPHALDPRARRLVVLHGAGDALPGRQRRRPHCLDRALRRARQPLGPARFAQRISRGHGPHALLHVHDVLLPG